MKANWVETVPAEEGWYWIKYKNKRKTYTVCPALFLVADGINVVHSARNDIFFQSPNKPFTCGGIVEKSIRFGPKIEEPDNE